ncbi:MAG: Re/Si-specific NAD(P)(+) transhydrogenase subunit alpha [Planctomycetota bacterium]|nr:Re/Si-specific NAD(P)(+) transhydrogenase subunit alpha [Planctomycetota bacterium]
MIIGVPTETYPDERRVALVPSFVSKLTKAGMEILVEEGAGSKAGYPDATYKEQGARLVPDASEIFSKAKVVLRVHVLGGKAGNGRADLKKLQSGQVLIGLLNPLGAPESAKKLAKAGATSFALELLPRISRAQPMDVLSSMATIAGYKAVLMAAGALKKMFPMMITAAGTIAPARVFVVGAGVAGLQAIATARRLGGVVQSYDVRPVVKEQVESLGAKFLVLELQTKEAEGAGGYAKAMGEEFYSRQRKMMTSVVAESDVVITTAAIPGKKSPILVTEEMVKGMRPGSIIVDLAAEGGGNCELTKAGETVEVHGVTLMGPLNLPSSIPYHASQMYSKNVTSFLDLLVKDGELHLDREDEIIRDTLLTHEGEVVNARVRELLGLPAAAPTTAEGSGS